MLHVALFKGSNCVADDGVIVITTLQTSLRVCRVDICECKQLAENTNDK